MKITLALESPICHGAFGESAGNAVLARRMAIVSLPGMPRVPCVSGNALRGVLRRIVMRDLFRRADLGPGQIPNWDRLYAALANGGHLDGVVGVVRPDRRREVRESLPPLSVFGAALYTWMLSGHLSVGILWPRCRETLAAGLVAGGDGLSAEDLVEEVSHCRHVDREEQDVEVSGVTPMPTTMEVLSAGTVLESEVVFARHTPDVERGVVCYGLRRLDCLGGKKGTGFGRVSVEISEDYSEAYTDWLASTPDLRERLISLANNLKMKKKKGRGKRK